MDKARLDLSSEEIQRKIARAITALATAWFFFTTIWGIDETPGGGHIPSSGSACSMFAEHMIKWHTIYPYWDWYAVAKPPLEHAYCHHPFGVFWAQLPFVWLFPHENFVMSMPAVVMSTLTPPLLYRIGRRIGGEIPGAAAALGFVVLPITIGYSSFASLEVMTIFGALLFYWGHLEHEARPRRRYLAASLLGVCIACFGDWIGYMFVGVVLGWALLRAYLLPRRLVPRAPKGDAEWWALSSSLAVATAVVTLGLFQHANRVSDWLSSADTRGNASNVKLSAVLTARAPWIDFSFTPLAILVGKVAAVVALARFLLRRRDADLLPLAALLGAVVQYVVFKGGADVHIFWPHYFGAYYALGMAALAAAAFELAAVAKKRFFTSKAASFPAAFALAVGVVPSLAVLPDGVRSLKIWRETGGRYDDKGALFRNHIDLNWLLAKEVRPKLRAGEIVGVHPGTQWGWEHQWAIAGLYKQAARSSADLAFWVGRGSGMGADELKAVAQKNHLRIYGDVILVERNEAPAPLDAYSTHEREPNALEWLFTNNTEPVRELDPTPDPFLTWEWRDALGEPCDAPAKPPSTLDEERIAHNAAVARGDAATAMALEARILAELDEKPETTFSGGHRLLGVRATNGVKPSLEIWFEAAGPMTSDATFDVRSTVIAASPTSLVPIDPTPREMAFPPSISTKLWKRGYIYRDVVELKHRIGTERYSGAFVSRGEPAPRPANGKPVDLLVLR